MTSTAESTMTTTQVYQVYIKATPDAIWDAITKPDWATRYGYRAPAEYDLRPGGAYRALATDEMRSHGAPEVMIEGEVIEADPPRRLVQSWHAMFDADIAAEPPTRLTWEIEELGDGLSRLTVVHDLEGAPKVAAIVSGAIKEAGGGWSWTLSDMKTLLETGSSLQG